MSSQTFQHSHALVDAGAEIGAGTRVWEFAHVMSGAQIGENCNIGAYSFIEKGVKLGNQVTVKNGVQVWEGVVAEDGVFFGPNCILTNHLSPRAFVKKPKQEWLKQTLFRKGATIGAGATIVCGITIGRYAFIAAGSVVTKDVPDYALFMGVPARFHSWVCQCANQLQVQDSKAECGECHSQYQLRNNILEPVSL